MKSNLLSIEKMAGRARIEIGARDEFRSSAAKASGREVHMTYRRRRRRKLAHNPSVQRASMIAARLAIAICLYRAAGDSLIHGGQAGVWKSAGRNAATDSIPDALARPTVFSAADSFSLDGGRQLFGLETAGNGGVSW